MSNTIVRTLATLVVLGAITAFAVTIGPKKPLPSEPPVSEPISVQATLSGEYLCLYTKEVTPQSDAKADECVPGIKTDGGKYYALDYNLMSGTRPPIIIGDKIEAAGLVTPIEALSSDHWQAYNITGIFSVTDSFRKLNTAPISYECNGDAKVCADGSTVGRMGSECRFAACPPPDATSAKIQTSLGQASTGLSITILPKQIISDSRCPIGVQCIWAGTVEVRAMTSSKVAHGEQNFTLGEPRNFADFTITLVEVTPAPKAEEKIKGSSYRFTFEVKKK